MDMLPDTQEMRYLEDAATGALARMEQLFGNGAMAEEDAHGYRLQLKGMKTQVRRLADVFARADSVHGETYPVYTVDVRRPDNGVHDRRQPPTKEFQSWEDSLAYLADVDDFHTITIRSGMRRGDGPAAATPAPPAPARPAADPPLDAFVTVFTFSSPLLPAACPACPHTPANHIYIGEFTAFTLPGGATGALPTHGTAICRLDDCTCTGTWNLSVLSPEDTALILPGDGER